MSNNNDLIWRKDAVLELQRYGVGCTDADDFTPEQAERFVISRLNAIPAVDAAEVRHGEWIWNKDLKRVCSECGNSASFSLTANGWIEGLYCQTCGARMDGRREDGNNVRTD